MNQRYLTLWRSRLKFSRAVWILVGAALVGSVYFWAGLRILPASAQSTETEVVASSSPSTNKVRYIRLLHYWNFISGGHVSWPSRQPDCSPSSVTSRKTMPWLGQKGSYSIDGNKMDQPGNCSTRYHDGGKSGGVWLKPSAFGGWTSLGTNDGGWGNAVDTNGQNVDSAKLRDEEKVSPRIWGTRFRDSTEHSWNNGATGADAGLFRKNGWWPNYGQKGADNLFSNGITVFRNKFTLTQSLIERLDTPDASVVLDIVADDWYRVYVNGRHAITKMDTISRTREWSIPKSFLQDSNGNFRTNNIITIQVVDKANWTSASTTEGNAAGLWYHLELRNLPVITNWNYINPNLVTNPATSPFGSTPYESYKHGELITIANTVTNNGDGAGASYRHRFLRRINSGSWGNIRSWTGEGGLQPGKTRTRTVQFTLPDTVPNGTRICFMATIDPFKGQSTPSLTITSSGHRSSEVRCVTVNTPQPSHSCGTLLQNPRPAEPGEGFDATANFSIGAFPPGVTYNYEIYLTIDTILPRTGFGPRSISGTNAPMTVSETSTNLTSANAGTFNATYEITGDFNAVCTGTIQIATKPYLKVFGNDVMAGGSWPYDCTAVTPGGINTTPAASNNLGSSVQHAAFALGAIRGFSSANLRPSGAVPEPHAGLSFANSDPGFSTSWPLGGGGYIDPTPCLLDYFSFTSGSTPFAGPGDLASSTAAGQYDKYYVAGDLELSAIPPIPNGRRKALFVDGTLTIGDNDPMSDDNIRYAADSWGNSTDNIPALYVVARNIVIRNNVTRLDGVYIAQPGNASEGIISTCDVDAADPSQLNVMYTSCRNQLVVNGAFIARRINFYRAYGTLRDSVPGEDISYTAGCKAASGAVSATGTCASEVFRFSPEVYLVPSPFNNTDAEGTGAFRSFNSLPPNL